MKTFIIASAVVIYCAAVIGAAHKIGRGRLTLRNIAKCAVIALAGIAALLVPFLLGAFIGLLKYAKNLPP